MNGHTAAPLPERLSVEGPLTVAEGGQDLEGVVADAGQDDPVVGNAEVIEVGVEVLVVAQGLVAIADVGNFTLDGPANLTGTKAAALDAKMAPLANNGGTTKTHLPALDRLDRQLA